VPEKSAGERGAQRAAGPAMPELGYEAAIARLDQAVRATDAGRTATAGGQAAAQRRSGAKRKR
jgi:hypothetical protein